MIEKKTDGQILHEREQKKMEEPQYKCMTDGMNSLFWKQVAENIEAKITANSNLETVADDKDLLTKKGMIRAFRIVLNLPDDLKNK